MAVPGKNYRSFQIPPGIKYALNPRQNGADGGKKTSPIRSGEVIYHINNNQGALGGSKLKMRPGNRSFPYPPKPAVNLRFNIEFFYICLGASAHFLTTFLFQDLIQSFMVRAFLCSQDSRSHPESLPPKTIRSITKASGIFKLAASIISLIFYIANFKGGSSQESVQDTCDKF